MAWVILVLVTLIGLGRFADFLLGPRGDRRLKDKLVHFYVCVSEGNWLSVIEISARQYHQFLQLVFEKYRCSWRFLLNVFLYSFVVSVIVIGSAIYAYAADTADAGIIAALFTLDLIIEPRLRYLFTTIVAINYALDLVSMYLLIRLLAYTKIDSPLKSVTIAWASVSLILIIFTLAVALSMTIGNALMIGLPPETRWQLLWFWLKMNIMHPWNAPSTSIGHINVSIFSVSVLIPFSVLLIIVMCSLVIYYSRGITKTPMLLIIERLEEAKSGVFTIISSATTLIIGIITALQKVLG
jgi:hypothetical protein